VLFHIFVKEPKADAKDEDAGEDEEARYHAMRARAMSITSMGVPYEPTTKRKSLGDRRYSIAVGNQVVILSQEEMALHEKKWSDWFRKLSFYKVGFLYMMTRLY